MICLDYAVPFSLSCLNILVPCKLSSCVKRVVSCGSQRRFSIKYYRTQITLSIIYCMPRIVQNYNIFSRMPGFSMSRLKPIKSGIVLSIFNASGQLAFKIAVSSLIKSYSDPLWILLYL